MFGAIIVWYYNSSHLEYSFLYSVLTLNARFGPPSKHSSRAASEGCLNVLMQAVAAKATEWFSPLFPPLHPSVCRPETRAGAAGGGYRYMPLTR